MALLELERRGFEVAYIRTPEGCEVDFSAHRAGDAPLLIQASLESEGDDTWERELRALEAAAGSYPEARPCLVTLDDVPPQRPLPGGLTWAPAAGSRKRCQSAPDAAGDVQPRERAKAIQLG